MPPLGYGYKMHSSLFLSKITFISLVSLTSVSVWSHTSTLTGNSHLLGEATSSAMPPTSKRIPLPQSWIQDEGNKQICSLSSTSPQAALYSCLGPSVFPSYGGPETLGSVLLTSPL